MLLGRHVVDCLRTAMYAVSTTGGTNAERLTISRPMVGFAAQIPAVLVRLFVAV